MGVRVRVGVRVGGTRVAVGGRIVAVAGSEEAVAVDGKRVAVAGCVGSGVREWVGTKRVAVEEG